MNRKEMYCRMMGYTFSLLKYDENKCEIFTPDYNTYEKFKMKMRERGCYEDTVKYSDVDCIWTEIDYEIVEVLKGKLEVTNDDFDFNDKDRFLHHEHFANYKNCKYFNYLGYNHNYIYRLGSYDINSQKHGFIMYTPGYFIKMVHPSDIEIEYESLTWCLYNGYKLCAFEGEKNHYWIMPYFQEYNEKILKKMGFVFKAKYCNYFKYVNIDDISDLWTINKAEGRFKDINMEPEILKGAIHE